MSSFGFDLIKIDLFEELNNILKKLVNLDVDVIKEFIIICLGDME